MEIYNPLKETVVRYIEHCKEKGIIPTFKGETYLINLNGMVTPNISFLRILKEEGNEHYLITEDRKLRGLNLPEHAGKSGIHEISDILLKNKISQLENVKVTSKNWINLFLFNHSVHVKRIYQPFLE